MQSAFRRRAWLYSAFAVATLGTLVGVRATIGSDHQDTPDVELSPRMDINDVFAFPGSNDDRIVLVMTTSSPLTPAQTTSASFDPNLLYQLKIDNNGDAVEDLVVQFTFEGMGANQRVHVRGPARPETIGTRNTIVDNAAELIGNIDTTFGAPNAIQVFAGRR